MIGDKREGMKSSEKLKLKRKVPANKNNSRFSKGHFWEDKMCQNSITCQSKLSFWVSKIKIGPLMSYFFFKCFISFKICHINYNLLTPISHPFHLTSFLRPDNLKRKLTVCTGRTGTPKIRHRFAYFLVLKAKNLSFCRILILKKKVLSNRNLQN